MIITVIENDTLLCTSPHIHRHPAKHINFRDIDYVSVTIDSEIKQLEGVIRLPDTIKIIKKDAFVNMDNAPCTIIIPEGVEIIEESAFKGNDAVSVILEGKPACIQLNAFEGIKSLETAYNDNYYINDSSVANIVFLGKNIKTFSSREIYDLNILSNFALENYHDLITRYEESLNSGTFTRDVKEERDFIAANIVKEVIAQRNHINNRNYYELSRLNFIEDVANYMLEHNIRNIRQISAKLSKAEKYVLSLIPMEDRDKYGITDREIVENFIDNSIKDMNIF